MGSSRRISTTASGSAWIPFATSCSLSRSGTAAARRGRCGREFLARPSCLCHRRDGTRRRLLVQRLLDARANVVCLVRDWVPQSFVVGKGLLDRVNVVRGELQDYETIDRALNEYEIATVLH